MPLRFERQPIPDVVLIHTTRRGDSRGWFAETYKRSEFSAAGLLVDFVQDNESFSAEAGTIRGLHYQAPPYSQGKLVSCLAGAIYDVAVDMRSASETFGKWISVQLRATDGVLIWIPTGFAHGFQTLEPDTHIAYKVTVEYEPRSESGIRWDDPALAIEWPVRKAVVSARDQALPAWEPSSSPFDS
jgi:dTDP-4-dehydrorhamnose 3,5-epimerase